MGRPGDRVAVFTECAEEGPGSTGQGGGQQPPGETRGTVPQKTDRPACGVRVKRWCKRPPVRRVTGVARQTPPGARSRSPALASDARTFEGGPPECAGGPLEAAGNGRRRWMVAATPLASYRTRPTGRPIRLIPLTCALSVRSPQRSAQSPQQAGEPSRSPRGFGRRSRATGGCRCRASRSRWRARVGPGRPSPTPVTNQQGCVEVPQRLQPGAGRDARAAGDVGHRCPNVLRVLAWPWRVKTSSSGAAGDAARCAAIASRTTCGSGTGRTLAAVLGGAMYGGRPETVTSCRSTVICRRRKSSRSTVRPKHSPCRNPVPAANVTCARRDSGIATRSAST